MRKIASYKVARFRQNLLRKLATDPFGIDFTDTSIYDPETEAMTAERIAEASRPGYNPIPWNYLDLLINHGSLSDTLGLYESPITDIALLEKTGPTKERARAYKRLEEEAAKHGAKINPAAVENVIFGFKTPEQRAAEKAAAEKAAAEKAAAEKAAKREATKQKLKAYAPWVGGGAGLGALLGGGVGYGVSKGTGGTLLGALLGGVGGGAAGGLGKYLYDKHVKK